MAGAFHDLDAAIAEARSKRFGESKRKRPVLRPVPQPHGHADFFQRKSPWLRVDLRIRNHARDGRPPGLSRTFEASLESFRVAQHLRIHPLQREKQYRPEPER